MANDFPGLFTTRELWFDRAVGLYGWLDTTFPVWVYNFALIPAGLIAILVLCELSRAGRTCGPTCPSSSSTSS